MTLARGMHSGISVVIPLYNKAGTIQRAIDSALGQRGVEVEVVVVDDGSSDGSTSIAESYGARITLVRQANAGPSAARNRGVSASRHPVIAFLDADDEYAPGCLLAHVRCRDAEEGPAVTLASFRSISLNGGQRDEVLKDRVTGLQPGDGCWFVPGFRAAFAINVHIGCVAATRTLLDAVGGFDERLVSWEISDFLLRLLRQAPRTALLDGIYLNVHETPGSQSTITHGSPRYLAIFTDKLIDFIDTVPVTERRTLVRQLTGFLRALWASGDIREFKRLTTRAAPLFRAYGERGRLGLAARLPEFALRTLRQLPRIG